jgi:hypothetical protein
MGTIRSDSPLERLKRPWNPLLRMRQTDEVAPKMGISTFWGRFAFAQLTYMDLPYSDLNDLAARFQSDRLNWDSGYAQDLAMLLSILVTNNIKLDSWEVFDRIVKAYRQGWRERFLVSLFCEATSHQGYCGAPLYFSELVGYTSRGAYQPGLLEVMERSGADEAVDWLHRRMLIKLKHPEVRQMLEKDFAGSHRCRVYPFLVFGSQGWAAYNQFEKRGGLESIVRRTVPAEVRREVYIMAICCFSSYFHHSREHWSGLFSQACRVGINGLQYAGASTSIEVCPLFAFLQSEIGHLMSSQFSGGKVDGSLLSEVMDRMQMNSYVSLGGVEKAEEELDFSNLWPGAPEEMMGCVEKDLREIRTTRAHAKYQVNPDWLKKLREM